MTCPSQSSRFNHPEYFKRTVQTYVFPDLKSMKFTIVKASPVPIRNPLGPKYLHRDPVCKYNKERLENKNLLLTSSSFIQRMVYHNSAPLICAVILSVYQSGENPHSMPVRISFSILILWGFLVNVKYFWKFEEKIILKFHMASIVALSILLCPQSFRYY